MAMQKKEFQHQFSQANCIHDNVNASYSDLYIVQITTSDIYKHSLTLTEKNCDWHAIWIQYIKSFSCVDMFFFYPTNHDFLLLFWRNFTHFSFYIWHHQFRLHRAFIFKLAVPVPYRRLENSFYPTILEQYIFPLRFIANSLNIAWLGVIFFSLLSLFVVFCYIRPNAFAVTIPF